MAASTALARFAFNSCLMAALACLSGPVAHAEDVTNQNQYDAALAAAESTPGPATINVTGGGGLLTLQSGPRAYPPGLSTSLQINFDRTTLDVGGASAPDAVLTLGPAATLNFTGAVTPPVPGSLAGFLRVGYGGAGTLNINGGTISVSAITGGSDPGRVIVGGGGGTGISTVNMTGGLLSFSRSGSNYSGFAIGRTAGPAGVFNQSGGQVTVSGLLSADFGTQGGTGTYNLTGDAVFEKNAANAPGVLYVGSRPDTGTGIAGSGTVHVSDAASFTFYSDNIFVGDARATGAFIQDGAASSVYLQADNGVLFGSNNSSAGGANGGGHASYTLSAGTLTVAGNSQSLALGYAAGGSGTLEVSGGTATILGNAGLSIGTTAGATGAVIQTGGEVNARVSFGAGTGSYSLSGGTLKTGTGITGGPDDTFTLAGGTLNFLSGATTSSGFVTTLSAASTIDVDGTSAAWNSATSGSGTLNKTGDGILSIGGTNTGFTGSVTVTEGTLALTNAAALSAANSVTLQGAGTSLSTSSVGTATVTIGALNGNGALNLGNSRLGVTVGAGETAAYSGIITAGFTSNSTYGRFDKTGAGTLVINGARMADTATGTGEFYVTQGILAQTAGDTAIAYLDVGTGTTAGAGNVGAITISGGTLTVNRTFSVGAWGGSGTANQTGGTVFIPDPGSCTSCGAISIGNQGGTGVYNLSGGTIDFTGGVLNLGRTTSASSPAFSGTLNVSGSGEIIARAGNVILGNWLVSGSGVAGIGDGILNQSGGTIRIENDAELYLSAKGDGTYNLSGGVLQIGGSSLKPVYASGGGTYAFNLGGGTIEVLDTALSTNAAATLVANTTSTIDTNGLGATWNGALTGSGTLAKQGAGTLTLGSIATTGYLDLAEGDLASTGVNNSISLLNVASGSSHTLQIASGTTFTLTGSNPGSTAGLIYNGSTLNLTGGGTLKVGANTLVIGYPIGSGPDTQPSGGTLNLSGSAKLDLNSGTTFTDFYVGVGSGVTGVTGTVTQGGSSRVTLGTNMIIGGDGATATYTLNGNSSLVTGANTFIFIGLNEAQRTAGTTGTLSLNDTATFSQTDGYLFLGMATAGGSGGSGTYAGDGAIVQNGNSSVNLSGTSVAIGLDAGGTGRYELNGGQLTIDTTLALEVGSRAGSNGLLVQTGGTLTAAASVQVGSSGSGAYTISGGTAAFDGGLVIARAAGSTGVANQNGGTVTAHGLTFGAGTGAYNLNAGTFTVQGSIAGNAAGGPDTLTFGGGTLKAGGALSANANFSTVIADDSIARIDTNTFAITWNSAISGTGDLMKSGAGVLSLGAANTSFTGDVTVGAGILALTNAAALSAANGVTVSSGATFDIGSVPSAPSSTYQLVSIGTLNGAGTVDVGTNALRVDIASGETASFSGTLVADKSSWESSGAESSLVKDGAGTLVIDNMSMTRGNLYVVSGALSQTSGTTSLTYLAVGEQAGASGILSVTGGRLDIGEGLQVGDWGGTGTVNQSGGAVSLLATCASPSNCVAMNIGNQGGTGTYNLTGGQLLIAGGSHSIGRNAGAQPSSSGTLNISGNALMQISPNGAFGTGLLVIGDRDPGSQTNSTGVLNQNGGTVRFVDTARLYLGGYGSGTYNLNAGTLEIGGASLLGLYGGGGNTTGSYAFNLGGGTIKVIGTALTTSVAATLVSGTTSTIDTNSLGAAWGGVLSGDGALAKIGGGTLTLMAANSYTGGTNLSGGTLALGNAGALSSGALSFTGSATLALNGSYTLANAIGIAAGAAATINTGINSVTLNGGLSGNGALTKAGSGTLILQDANSYAGGTTLSAGTLAIGDTGALGSGSLSFAGSGTLAFLDAFTFTNQVSLGAGSIATFDTGANAVTLSGPVSGSGGLTKAGAGVLTLAGGNSFSGPTSVSAGTLAVTGALTASNVTVGSGATLTGSGSIGGAVAVQAGGVLSGASSTQLSMGALTLASGSVINANLAAPSLSPLFNVGGALTLDGTVNITSPNLTIGVYRLFSYGGVLTNNGLEIGTVPGGLDASDILVAAGNGRVDLVNTNGAVLQYWNGSATLGPGTGVVTGGSGTWSATNGNWTDAAGTFNAPMQPQPSFAVFDGSAGTVTVNNSAGAVSATGMQFVVSDYLIQGGSITLSGAPAVIRVGDGTGAGASMTATISAPLAGSTSVEKADLGRLVLSGANTYSGATLISAGTLALSGSGSIAASSGVTVNGAFDISATTSGATIANLGGTGTVALGARTLTIANGSGTFAGTLSGTGGLSLQAGTLGLSGANNYSGNTAIGAGATLALSGAGRIADTSGVVANGTLDLSGASGGVSLASLSGSGAVQLGANTLTLTQAADTFSGAISGTGALALQAGSQILSHANTYSGGTTLTGGTLKLENAAALGSGALAFASSATLLFGGDLSLANAVSFASGANGTVDVATHHATLTGSLTGAGTLTKAGTGDLTLSGANAGFTGAVRITRGNLLLAGAQALGTANAVNISAGAGLDISAVTGGAGFAVGALSGAGTVTTGSNRLTTSGGAFSGTITGMGGLTKVGAGTFTMSGANNYQGGTVIEGGILAAGAANTFSQASATTINAGGTLDLGGFSQAIGTVALSGGTLQNGALAGAVTSTGGIISGLGGTASVSVTLGTTTLLGTNGFAGPTTVSGGTLVVAGTLTGNNVTVGAGGTLTGSGSIARNVVVNAGGAISGVTGTTLSLGSLSLDAGAVINANLTAPSTAALFAISGHLILDGTLNITSSSLDVGVSRLFSYGGTLINNGLEFGTLPSDVTAADLSIIANSGRVDLINTAGTVLQFWNGNAATGPGSGTINGGSGTWNTTNGNWTNADATVNSPMQPQPGFAIFEGAAGTVTVDDTGGAVGVTGMQFMTSGYVVQGDPIMLSAAETVIRVGDGTLSGAATTATIASELTGANGINKTDLGTLVLSGTNTYTGATVISGGTLALAGTGSIAASSGVEANGTFDISATHSGAIIATLTGTGAVALGGQTLTIANAAGTFSGAVSGSGGLDIAGGTQTLTGNSTLNGGITLSGGSVAVGSAAALGSGILSFAADGTLSFLGDFSIGNALAIGAGITATVDSGSSEAGIGGTISGPGGLLKTGTGALTLSGANTYAGGTTLAAGSLVLGNTNALGSGALTFAADSTLAFDVSGAIANGFVLANGATGTFDTAGRTATLAGPVSGNGVLSKTGNGTLNLAGANTYTGGTILSAGTIGLLDPGALGSGGLNVTGAASIAFGSSQTFANSTSIAAGVTAMFDTMGNAVTLSGLVSGNGALGKTGTGTLTFANANSYAGGTVLAGGTVVLNNATALGTGGVTVDQSTQIVVGFAAPFTYAMSLSSGATATLDTGLFDITMASGVSGAGGLTITGGRTATFTAPTTYSGATSVSSGTLHAGAAAAFSAASAFTVANGATLDLGGTGQTIGSLAGGGSVHLGAATLTTGADNTDSTFSGLMDGTGGLTKVGTGNFTVASTNTYSGDTSILDGIITVASDGALGTGRISVSGGGALAFAGAYALTNRLDVSSGAAIDTSNFPVTLTGDITGSGSVTKTGSGTLILAGNNSFTGGLFVDGGTLGATTPQALGSGALNFLGTSTFLLTDASLGPITNALNLASTVTLTPPTGGVAELSGTISGTGGLSAAGTGTVMLSGKNTYSGPTSVGAGMTLQTSAPGALPATSAVALATGSTLNLAGNSQTVGSVSGGGAIALGSATLTAGGNNTDTSYTGTLSGSGSFDKVGTGKMVFDGTGNIGSATVAGGSLIVGGETGSNASLNAPVTVEGGGTIGGHGTVGPITVVGNGELSPGNSIGTLTVTGNLALNPAATFLLEVNPTQSDVVNVIGNAQLAGLLQVDTSAGWSINHPYVFLTATGAISGTFSDVVDDLPLADAEVIYGANSVTLVLLPSQMSFASLAATPSQAATANSAQSLGLGNPVFDAILMLNAPAAQAAFSSLSGGIYPSASTTFLLDSRFIREATLGRVRSSLPSGPMQPGAPGSSGAWAQAMGSWGTLSADANAPSLSRTVGGLFAGLDGHVGDALRLGFATGYSQTTFNVTSLSSSGSSDDYHVALYGAAGVGIFDLRAGAAFTWHDLSVNRTVAFPGFIDQDTADTSAHTGQVYGELALPWTFAAGTVEPFANAAYVRGSMDGFTEAGGASALTSQAQSADAVFTTLGARAATSFTLGAIPASLRGTIGWQHAFGDLTPMAQFSFASGSLPFSIAGVSLPANALALEGGFDFAITQNTSLSVAYSGLWGDTVSDNAFKGTLQIQF
ncbi:autotransporter-associated beta strand repeat-containing protein [Aquabacter sp. CN5-332]|uniref:autotransporter-associated beta strand repeat-containing protein n=1 Tax=Aquabacter sp. CN5-332 TaxID=3156608 RepID=UPI0032B3A588